MKFTFLLKKDLLIPIVLIASVIYLVTAFNSLGFYHADEQYQIIEFAGVKLGTHQPNELAWEFKSQIRPSLQPVMCFIFLKILTVFKINDPYLQAFLIRLISALLSVTVITFFIQNTKDFIANKSTKTAYYLLSFFLWFTPLISVRFSSETWSGLSFMLALIVFLKNSEHKLAPFKIGTLLGLSFLFRFQIAFAILGFALWLIVVNRSQLTYLIKISVAFIILVFLGFLLDNWFYGEVVFTPWNYFYTNIIEGAASNFGTSPWYYYYTKILRLPTYFIGLPIILSFLIILLKKPKHYILWIVLPFLIGHSLISHKEERFLFPMIYFIPLILIEGYILLTNLIKKQIHQRIINYVLITVFLSINIVGIIAMGQKSAGVGTMEISKYIHEHYGKEKINLVFCSWANPYDPWHGLPIKFYSEENLSDKRINTLCELNDSLFTKDAINLFVIRKIDKENIDCFPNMKQDDFHFETQSVPNWIEKITTNYKGFNNQNILELYRNKKDKK